MSEKEFKYLNDILNEEELRQISSYVRIKLESHLEGRHNTIDGLKTQLDNSAANAEKKTFAVDRELQNTKSKLQMTEDFVEKLKNQLKEAEEALQKSRHDYYEILENKDSLTYELNSVNDKMKRFSAEKLDLTEMLDRRQEEIQSLQNELKNVCLKLQSSSEGRVESTYRSEELEMKTISIQHQEIRMSQERQLYQKQIQSLNEELNAKVNELLSLRRDRTIQLFELQSSLEQKTDENTKYLDEMKHLKEVVDRKDKHIEGLAQRIRELQVFSAQIEEDFKNEITAQNNLIELHKQSNNDLKKRNESLIQTIEEMQKLLQTAKESHNEMQTSFGDNQNRLSEQLNQSLEQNSVLSQELDQLRESVANTSRDNLESEFERQYPLAASTKKILDNNMSFTQIFNELVSSKQQLEDQKSENTVLKEHLHRLAEEAEENAPLLHRKIQEHQRSLQSINELQNQISSLVSEREQWLQEKDTLLRINKQYEREIQRFERENKDLSKQIRALIKSVQEARGFTVSHEPQDSQISSSFSDVPQDLVTFKDIEELQTRNQELMNALREANERIQKISDDQNDGHRYALRKDLEEAVIQLENLRAERLQQTKMVESLVKQRDIFKMLSSSGSPDASALQKSPVAFSSLQHTDNRISAEELNELKTKLNEKTKQFEEYREESALKVKEMSDNNEKLRQELSNLKIDLAKISSELTFTQERLQMFKTNGQQFQRENDLLRERNTVLNENIKKQEKSLLCIRDEVISLNQMNNKNEVFIENLKNERDLYRNNELKLIQEKEVLIRNEEHQKKLITTLQSVENNFNQMENHCINDLKIQNNRLEKECNYLRTKCDKDSERHSEASLLWEKQSQELQNRIDNEIEKYLQIHKELTEYQTKVKALENDLNCLKTGVTQSPLSDTSVSTESDRALQSQLIVIREQYIEAQNEVKLLRDKLVNSQKASQSLQTINSSLEQRLNENQLTIEVMEEKTKTVINDKDIAIKSLTKELNEFKDRYKKINEEKNGLESDHKDICRQYLERINKLTNSLIDSNSAAEKATLNEKRALEDRNVQIQIASEAQANYEKELLQHSRDAQLITSLRKQLEIFQSKVVEAESAANKAQEHLVHSHELWLNEKKAIEMNNSKTKEKCNDLERINDTLNGQLEILGNRLVSLKNNSSLSLLSKDEEIENTNRLLEVIKFLRKEKEVLQTQITALESEDSRHKAVIDNLKKELSHIQNQLSEEKIQSNNLMTSVSQHKEMVNKIEMINVLSESNTLLRNEKSVLETKCRELTKKLTEIDSQKLTKDVEELTLKVETKNAENIALREELKHWQKRTTGLTEQLSKTSAEEMRRISDEKLKLQQQTKTLTQELNKLNQEIENQRNVRKGLETQMQTMKTQLESKTVELNKVNEDLNSLRTEGQTNQNTVIQLRKVARKYKQQFDEQKVEFERFKLSVNTTPDVSVSDNKGSTSSDSQVIELTTKIEELNAKIIEMEKQIEKLLSDLNQMTEEKDAAKAQAVEKEERAKKIALQAKQRLAAISGEKQNILKEKEMFEKNCEELKENAKHLEQNVEEMGLRMATIKSQYEAKTTRLERDLSDALKLLEDSKNKQQTQQQSQQTSPVIGVTTASVQTSSQSSSNPVRHSVHPQPATVQPISAKSTPTASIRPLAVAPTLHRTGRTSNVTARSATVATVQPTTEELSQHLSVPQATVQPTQTVCQLVSVPPTTSSDIDVMISLITDDQNSREMNSELITAQNEMPELIPELTGPFIDDNISSEQSREEQMTSIAIRPEVCEPSTSVGRDKITLKRSRTSDEVCSQLSPKKMRSNIKTEVISTEALPQYQHKDIVSNDNEEEDDDDDVIIIETDDEEEEQRDHNIDENVDEEEDEEEEDYEEDNPEDNDNEEVYDNNNEEYDEEEDEEEEEEEVVTNYEEEQNEASDNESENLEDIEVVGVSDDMPEQNTDDTDRRQQSVRSEVISETNEPVVSTTMPSQSVTSVVTSSTESNPFIQIPTPIQRPFGTSGRQSFYLSHAQQSSAYDEGDGIVPSTPTLFVPRRGDSFADALNSPRVPQSRFVFSGSSVPESTPLSQLGTGGGVEGSLGVDDTRMDLSQFDDNNNGRSVPTTPLANSPAVDNVVHSTVQSSEVDTETDPNFGVDPNVAETIVPIDSSGGEETSVERSEDNEVIDVSDSDGGQRGEQISETQIQQMVSDSSDPRIEDIESIPTSTSLQRFVPTARRGRAFSSQRGALQRQPIMAPTSETPSSDTVPARAPIPPTGAQTQPQTSQQSGRTIRLRDSKFSTRGNFRGRPNRGSGPRPGSGTGRGGFHYNN